MASLNLPPDTATKISWDSEESRFDPAKAIYTPPQVATIGLSAVEQTAEAQKSGLGIALPILGVGLSEGGERPYMPPVLPGQVCGIVAQTSNGKTLTLRAIEAHAARDIQARGLTSHILVHVSVEEPIEELAYMMMACEAAKLGGAEDAGDLAQGLVNNWEILNRAALQVGTTPIYYIGSSLARAEDMPNLYMSNMLRAIEHLQGGALLDFKPVIAGLFFDFLQAFPLDPELRRKHIGGEEKRHLQVRDDIYRLRMAAGYFHCPVFVTIQAKQELGAVGKPPFYVPGRYDIKESSAVPERLDRIVTQVMPKSYHPPGKWIEPRGGGFGFAVQENHLLLKVEKQRGRLPAGRTFLCEIDYATDEIHLAKDGQARKETHYDDTGDGNNDD